MTNQNSSNTRTVLIVGAIAALVLIAGVIAVLANGSDDSDNVASSPTNEDSGTASATLSETQSVSASGTALHSMPEAGNDPSLGMTMPELSGKSFDGSAVEIQNDGKPKILIFLAHW